MALSWLLAPIRRVGLSFAVCLVGFFGPFFPRAAEPAVTVDDLRPGLVATYRDAARPSPAEVVQLEPTIALNLKPHESPHPRLAPDGGTVRWEGYLNILRPAQYQFSARLRGNFRLRVAGKDVLTAEVHEAAPVLKVGPSIQLEAGVHPLSAEFARTPGKTQVELFWQSPSFRTEPLAYQQLGHVPARVPARLEADRAIERGRYLVEEHSCVTCHQPASGDRVAKGLRPRQGPDLSAVGQRVYSGWIYRWLEAPHQLRPGAIMPRLFGADEEGRVERYLAARYLGSLGGPPKGASRRLNLKEQKVSIDRGKRLFTSTGCVACHDTETTPNPTAPAARSFYGLASPPGARTTIRLAGLGSKTTSEMLAVYLEDPLKVDPSGKMPHMLLQRKEAEDLARYLWQSKEPSVSRDLPDPPSREQLRKVFQKVDPRPEELAAFQRLPEEAQWLDLGKRLVLDKGCNQCHTIAPGGRPFAAVLARASFDDLKKSAAQDRGCLAAEPGPKGKAPVFSLTEADRKAVRRFLREGTGGAGSAAPAHAARVALQRFNCLACHVRDGEGGLTPELVEELRKVEKAENAEAISPPPLTGVGHKLRTQWVKQVLIQSGRARPWMGLRMPQFGPANVGHLPEALAALEGVEPDSGVERVPLTSAKLEAGRRLIGKQAFGCVSCHDIAGIPNSGTRGPDLALMTQRVRYEWYRRWLEQAQRMQPGTRMPIVFPDGQSLLSDILGGQANAQAEAAWAYLSLGPGLPLPDGLEPPQGLLVKVTDQPVILRTFMPEAGTRAIAVGYPHGVAVTFDAAMCRLAYAWSGPFLDASPVWNNRGGHPATVLGSRFWTAPPGCPLAATASEAVPDFGARVRDPAYGASAPDGVLYQGPKHLLFEGYTTGKDGLPTFRYRLNPGADNGVAIEERSEPLRSPVGFGVARRFALTQPPQQKVWLWAGEANSDPRLLDNRGADLSLDLKAGSVEFPVKGCLVVLPQGSDKVIALTLTEAPEGTRWHLSRHGGSWHALVKLPAPSKETTIKLGLNVWAPYRDEPALIKELASRK